MPLTYEERPTRDQVWLRGFLMGPTGSGKSRGALELAFRIFAGALPVTLINTEKGRGKLYADRYDLHGYIDLGDENDFAPESYVRAIDLAEERNRGGVILIDSVSHEWMGTNGILQQADRFGDWKTVRPRHNEFVQRLLAVEGHLIVTCRAKMKYEVGEEERPGGGKRQVITMLGVGPVQSDDLQYEFNLVGRFEQDSHDVEWSGHVDQLVGTVSNMGNDESAASTGGSLTEWLSKGNPPPPPPEAAEGDAVMALLESLKLEGFSDELIEGRFAVARKENRGVLSPEYVAKQTVASKERLAAKAKEAKEAAKTAQTDEPAAAAPAAEEGATA